MKALTVVLGLVFLFNTSVLAAESYPQHPQPSLTPGSLCKNGQKRRYPEGILYCNRSVGSNLKDDVVKTYDATFGYKVGQMGRRNFKIDHYIPLCMGGGNEATNLWPQHPSVYAITDPLEPLLCQKMAEGKLRQADAVRYIKQVKNDLSKASSIMEAIQLL